MLLRVREIGCPSFIKDCKHIQPGQEGYRTPAEREAEAHEQMRVLAAERAKKVVKIPIKEPGAAAAAEGEGEVPVEVEVEDDVAIALRKELRQQRRIFKENQYAQKVLKREARAALRSDKRADKIVIKSGRILKRGVSDSKTNVGTGVGGGGGGGSVLAIDDFIKVSVESDSDSDSDDDSEITDTSMSGSCSEVDGSNSDYEDVYNYEEGSPEMMDADEEMGFCNADTEGIHVDYLPRAKKIKFTEEGNRNRGGGVDDLDELNP